MGDHVRASSPPRPEFKLSGVAAAYFRKLAVARGTPGRRSPPTSAKAGLETTGGSYYFLDLTALGRQEEWEEPKGRSEAARKNVPDFAS